MTPPLLLLLMPLLLLLMPLLLLLLMPLLLLLMPLLLLLMPLLLLLLLLLLLPEVDEEVDPPLPPVPALEWSSDPHAWVQTTIPKATMMIKNALFIVLLPGYHSPGKSRLRVLLMYAV